jgi:hypothetical protein
MSSLYPHTIQVNRPNSVSPAVASPPSVRTLPYSGLTPAQETLLFYNLPARIQYKSGGARADNKVPGDVPPAMWTIGIPVSAGLVYGDIRNRDIIIDEIGRRYQVDNDYFTAFFGYQLSCTLLEL